MGFLNKFLDAIKMNDDFDDDDFFDEEDDFDDEPSQAKPKKRLFSKSGDDFDDEDDYEPIKGDSIHKPKATKAKTFKPKSKQSPKITPMKKKSGTTMEVNVIRPTSMEDSREIADTLLDSCTCVLNLEGLDVDIAQRIIDFTCGACYYGNGSLQKISSYIFILTPSNVDISGDFQDILNGAFDIPSMRDTY